MKKISVEAINPKNGAVVYLPELKELSRQNRNNPTQADLRMWKNVLCKRKTGFIFLRQKPINRFILDFYCSGLSLAIEIDGGYHKKQRGYDSERDSFLKQIGIDTIRFSNFEVLNNIETVKLKILSLVKGRSPAIGGERD